jgi:hypothetical protein
MKTKTHFAFRVDIWDETGNSIVEHIAGVDDFAVAEVTYWAAVARWPATCRPRPQLVRIAITKCAFAVRSRRWSDKAKTQLLLKRTATRRCDGNHEKADSV